MNIYKSPYWLLPSERCIGELRAVELRFNPHHDEKGRFFSWKGLDKSNKSGIIKSCSEIRFNPYHDAKGKFTSGMSVKLPEGKEGRLANKGLVTKIVQIAGNGTNKPIKIVDGLCKRFRNKPSDWSKFRGDGYVTYPDGTTKHVEVHWFLSKQNHIVDFKVKREFAK